MKPVSFFVIFCLFGCSKNQDTQPTPPTLPIQIPYPDGLSTNFTVVNGVSRKFLLYKPMGLTVPKAIVFVLHGGGGLGADGISQIGQHPMSVFRTVADTAKFIVVYPDGLPDSNGDLAWNDCRSDNTLGRNADDVSFFNSLISKLTKETGLTTQKVFMSGGSNGALMTYRYAFSNSSNLRAIATSSGNLAAIPFSGTCANGSTNPLPILMTHGTLDPQMPPNGGCVSNFGGNCNRGTVVSQDSTIRYWVKLNGLQNVTPNVTSFDLNISDTIRIVLEQKNPDPDKGWTAPIITDTINFIKRPNNNE